MEKINFQILTSISNMKTGMTAFPHYNSPPASVAIFYLFPYLSENAFYADDKKYRHFHYTSSLIESSLNLNDT